MRSISPIGATRNRRGDRKDRRLGEISRLGIARNGPPGCPWEYRARVRRFINHYGRRRPKLHGIARHDRSITRDAKRALNCLGTTNERASRRAFVVAVAVAAAITAAAMPAVAGNIDSRKQDRRCQISAR